MSSKAASQDKPIASDPPASSKPAMYVLVFGGVGIGFLAWALSPNESLWIKILFSLPLIAQLIGGYFHVSKHDDEDPFFYYFSMILSNACLFGYCFLWVCYRNNIGAYSFLSVLALVIITGIIICVGYMMCAFMKEPNRKKHPYLWKLRKGAEHEPMWAMSFLFFVIFLDVTYLFGFAFAFHDQYCLNTGNKAPALHMVNYDSPDDGDLSTKTVVAKNDERAKEQNGAKTDGDKAGQPDAKSDPSTDKDKKFYFYFDSGEAQLTISEGSTINNKCNLPSISTGSIAPTPTATPVEPPQRKDWLVAWLYTKEIPQLQFNKEFNRCSMERLKRRIEQETGNGTKARVVLVGQSDNQPVETLLHYKSNYELSEARVQNVQYGITEALKTENDSRTWHNLEWLTLPSSDEKKDDEVLGCIFTELGLKATEKNNPLTEMNKRVVTALVVPVEGDVTALQVKRESFRPLTLMDYMYFSIYTITTTGYGDIIPTTAYAKFVISIANICEVLFLVVFFNALVSIRESKKEAKNEQNRDEKKKQGQDEKADSSAQPIGGVDDTSAG